MQENNYIMLLTLTGFAFQYDWLRTGRRRALFIGSAALGLNLFTRLPPASISLPPVFSFSQFCGSSTSVRTCYGSDSSTTKSPRPPMYVSCPSSALQFLPLCIVHPDLYSDFPPRGAAQDPTLPPTYPWSTPVHEGVLGALFKPEKSIFLFDPLLVLVIILLVILWKRSCRKSAPMQLQRYCCWPPTSASTPSTPTGPEISPGETAMFSPPSS